MYTVAYFSTRVPSVSDEDIEPTLAMYRIKNERVGITGLLVQAKGSFLQVLEGDRTPVEALYARICRDDRHADVRQIGSAEIEHRHFPSWSMACKDVDAFTLVDKLLEPLVASGVFAYDFIAAAKIERYEAIRSLAASAPSID